MKRLLIPALAAGLLVTASTPAFAVMCSGSGPGLSISMGFRFGDKPTEREYREADRMRLRAAGVDASRVEVWNGCLRAFVRQPDGSEKMEFYDPDTLRQVY